MLILQKNWIPIGVFNKSKNSGEKTISPLIVVRPFTSSNLLIRVSAVNALPTWDIAGNLFREFVSNIGAVYYDNVLLALNQTQLINFEPSDTPYNLKIKFVDWLDQVTVTVWASEQTTTNLQNQALVYPSLGFY